MAECKQTHYSHQSISRADGKSASCSASYRAAESLYSTRFEQTFHSKSNSNHMGLSKIFAPKGTPVELTQRESLWNAVELSEKRKDAVLAYEFNAALPHELTVAQNDALLTDFLESHFVSRGIICDANIHLKIDNNHAHAMMTTRPVDESTESGFAAKKNRKWWAMGSIQKDRVAYTKCVNKHLAMAGSPVRYAHQTLAEQGIDRVAQIHIGPNIIAMDERLKQKQITDNGFVSNYETPDRLKLYSEIIDFNAASAKIKAKKAEQERIDKEAEKKAKAIQDLSTKNTRMVQSQREYLQLHGKATRVWGVRKPWMAQEPIKPVLDTLDGVQYKKSVSQWKFEGGEIRAAMKSVIKSIRGVITDYFSEFKSDIRDDIKHIDNNHHKNDDIEINGP